MIILLFISIPLLLNLKYNIQLYEIVFIIVKLYVLKRTLFIAM